MSYGCNVDIEGVGNINTVPVLFLLAIVLSVLLRYADSD